MKKPYNIWGEDLSFPVDDWKYEVANDDTRMGYWEWVESRQEHERTENNAEETQQKSKT